MIDSLHYVLCPQYRTIWKGITYTKIPIMAFKEQVPVRSKIAIGNNILEQVNLFIYLV
jgi:hypothetical protein